MDERLTVLAVFFTWFFLIGMAIGMLAWTALEFGIPRRFRAWILRCRAGWIESQIDHGEALLMDHRARLQLCYAKLRRIKQAEAMITPAGTLLQQALRRAGK